MGNVNSTKLDTKSIATTVATATVSQMQNCGGGQGSVQQVNIENRTGGNVEIGEITQDASMDINISCIQTAEFQQDVKAAAKVALEQLVKQANTGVSFGNSNISETQQQAISNVVSSINLNQLQSCLSTAMASQVVSIGDAGNVKIGKISQKIALTTTANCVANQGSFQAAANSLENTVKSTTDQLNEGVNMVASIAALACLGIVIASIIFQILKAPATLAKSTAEAAATAAGSGSGDGGGSKNMMIMGVAAIVCCLSSSSAGAAASQAQKK
jgi:hypothetical protein